MSNGENCNRNTVDLIMEGNRLAVEGNRRAIEGNRRAIEGNRQVVANGAHMAAVNAVNSAFLRNAHATNLAMRTALFPNKDVGALTGEILPSNVAAAFFEAYDSAAANRARWAADMSALLPDLPYNGDPSAFAATLGAAAAANRAQWEAPFPRAAPAAAVAPDPMPQIVPPEGWSNTRTAELFRASLNQNAGILELIRAAVSFIFQL